VSNAATCRCPIQFATPRNTHTNSVCSSTPLFFPLAFFSLRSLLNCTFVASTENRLVITIVHQHPLSVSNMQSLWPAFLLALVCLITLTHAAPSVNTPFPMPSCQGFTLEEASVDAIQKQLSSGKLTSRQLVQCYLDRINTVNPYLQ
jgi:hypothetical protein